MAQLRTACNAALVLHCCRYTRRRRMYPQPCTVVHAASQPALIAPHRWLYLAPRKGLQLHGATQVAAQVQQQQQQQQQDYEANLKQRQITAREWIAPWLVCLCSTYQAKTVAWPQRITCIFRRCCRFSRLSQNLWKYWQQCAIMHLTFLPSNRTQLRKVAGPVLAGQQGIKQ